MAKNLFGGEIASKLLPHYSCISDTEKDKNGCLVSDVCPGAVCSTILPFTF